MAEKILHKKKQHYVPQFYLDNWLGSDGLWVKNSISKEFKIYNKKETRDVAQEGFFYRVIIDDVVLDLLTYRFNEEINGDDFLNIFFNRLLKLKLFDDIINKKNYIVNYNEEVIESAREKLDFINKTFLEDNYSEIEGKIADSIKEFISRQYSVVKKNIDIKMYSSIILLFSIQLFRTRKVIDYSKDNVKRLILKRGDEEIELNEIQYDSYMKCMYYIMSCQFAAKLEDECFEIKVLRNHTKTNFLTSDSPACYVENCFGMMPVSPRIIIEIKLNKNRKIENNNKVKLYVRDIYKIEEVKIANDLIISCSHKFLFAKEKSDF